MPITRTPMVDDDGSGQTGTVVNNPWKSELYDQIDAVLGPAASLPQPGPAGNLMTSNGTLWTSQAPQTGIWIGTPYNAADYSASGGGTWTVPVGSVMLQQYALVGRVMHWQVFLNHYGAAMAVSGTVTALNIRVPGGKTLGDWQRLTVGHAVDGANGSNMDVYAASAGTVLSFTRRDGANWTAPPIYLAFVFALATTN